MRVGADAIIASHCSDRSKQHLTEAAVPVVLLIMMGESDISHGKAVISAAGLTTLHASLIGSM